MGMPISVLARGLHASGEAAATAVEAVYEELRDVDAKFSTYKQDSEVSRLQRGEMVLAECSDEIQDIAGRCAAARELTGGLFDATRPDGTWDPSGLVKGWAAERAARHLAAVTDLDWCLNAGGDVVVISPSSVPFVVGIQDPTNDLRATASIAVAGGGIATSGTAARGAHLYNPLTRRRVTRSGSISVAGPSLERADLLATAAFVLEEHPLDFIVRFDGYEALEIGPGSGMRSTAGWHGVALDQGRS